MRDLEPLESLLMSVEISDDDRTTLIQMGRTILLSIKEYIKQFTLHPALYHAINHLLGRGKLLRSIFSYILSRGLGIDDSKALKLATAIEYSHMASLIHDDIIDDSMYRRGVKSVHKKYGKNIAIIAGDVLILISNFLTNDLGTNPLRESLIAGIKMCSGEIMELDTGNNIDLDTYMEIIYLKTASFFEQIARVNAVIAKLSEGEINLYGEFGKALGMAFQIRDDILDLIGKEEVLGKPVKQDLNKPNIIIVIMNSKGEGLNSAVAVAKNILNQWIKKAINILNNLKLDRQYKKLLEKILESIKYRNI